MSRPSRADDTHEHRPTTTASTHEDHTDTRTNSRPDDYPPALAHPPSPIQAVARHPLIALLPVVLLIGAAIAVVEPARADVQRRVARRDRQLQPERAVRAGAAFAGTQFASAYSRAITAEDVVRPVARQTHLDPGPVSARLCRDARPGQPVPAHPGDRPDGARPRRVSRRPRPAR